MSSPGRAKVNRSGMSGDFSGWLKDEVMGRPSRCPRELRERVVRSVVELMEQGVSPSEFVAIRAIAGRLGIGSPATLRKWVRRAEIDRGTRPGRTTTELAGIREPKENAELRRAKRFSRRRRLSSTYLADDVGCHA